MEKTKEDIIGLMDDFERITRIKHEMDEMKQRALQAAAREHEQREQSVYPRKLDMARAIFEVIRAVVAWESYPRAFTFIKTRCNPPHKPNLDIYWKEKHARAWYVAGIDIHGALIIEYRVCVLGAGVHPLKTHTCHDAEEMARLVDEWLISDIYNAVSTASIFSSIREKVKGTLDAFKKDLAPVDRDKLVMSKEDEEWTRMLFG